jgi:hypothetical protein
MRNFAAVVVARFVAAVAAERDLQRPQGQTVLHPHRRR